MVCPLGQTMKPLPSRLSNRSAYTTIGCPLVKCMPGPGLLKPEKCAYATAGKTTRTSSDENEATTPRPANERLFEWEDTASTLARSLPLASGPNGDARLRRSVDRGPHPCVEQATSPSRKARHLTIEGTENGCGRSEPMRDQWRPSATTRSARSLALLSKGSRSFSRKRATQREVRRRADDL